jgi:hypothetical protein
LHNNTNQNLIGLVNESGVSIHHVVCGARICPAAFILHERAAPMVNRWCVASLRNAPAKCSGVNLTLNRIGLKDTK